MASKLHSAWQKQQSEDVQKMTRAIRRQLNADQLADVASLGADTGWPGFTYYTDTVKFYNRHEDAIWELLSDDAVEFGYHNVPAFVASFSRAGSADDLTGFKNLLVWYALETVARNLINDESLD